jgi:prepilin-type N-terminal cleavage/methylation domain-containing protein
MHFPRKRDTAFTLIELLVVIAILAILMSLLIPVTTSVKNAARKTQALNDIKQITSAVKSYYTEYSRYPLDSGDQGHDTTFTQTSNQDNLMDVLRASGRRGSWDDPAGTDNLNPRRQVFLSANYTKNLTNPAGGIVPANAAKFQNQYVDPWGTPYVIRVDGNYDNVVANPYSTNAGPASLNIDVIGWSFGIDKASTSNVQPKDPTTGSGDLKVGTAADDVVSWQ